MIEFKQGDSYGNNFNNGDEAKLSDSTRPRDEFGFRIKPGMQSDKWDFRGSNKNTYLQQAMIKGITLAVGTASGNALNPNYFLFKKEFTSSDLSDIVGYQNGDNQGHIYKTYTSDVIQSELIPFLKADIVGSPNVNVKDGNVIITRPGTYIIYYYVNFIYPYPHDTSQNERLFIAIHDLSTPAEVTRQSGRSCFTNDGVIGCYMGAITKETILNIDVSHTFSSETILCTCALNIIQLS